MKRRHATRPAGRRFGEAGDSLLEVIIAMVIIAIAVGPILGTLIESAASSAEHRSLAAVDSLLKSFAETATSKIELAPATHARTPSTPVFTACATTYRLISKPSTLKAHTGSAVTVFVTGFPSTATLSTFTVTVGTARATTSAPAVVKQSQSKSDPHGNMEITFLVPSGLPLTTPQPITVSDGAVSVVSSSRAGVTVTSSTPIITRSPDAKFRLGITSVADWHAGLGAFRSTCKTTTAPATPLRDGVQLVTLKAVSPTGVSDTLQFVLRNPAYAPPPKPTPTMSVVGQSTTLPKTGTVHMVTFVATVSVATTPAPAGTIAWSISSPHGAVTCTPAPTQTTTATSITSTCKVPVTPTASNVGRYTATASLPATTAYTASTGAAIATVYARTGSGTLSVSPGTLTAASAGNTLTFVYTAATGGTFNGIVEVGVTGAAGWSHPVTANLDATGGSGRNVVTGSGTTIEVTGVTLTAGQTLTVTWSAVKAPSTPGPYPFPTSEASLLGQTPAPLGASPTVNVVFPAVGAVAASANTVSAAISMPAGANFVVVATSSQSGPGDGVKSISGAGFTTAPVFTPIGAQQNFGTTAGDHEWAWSVVGTGGTGTVTVALTKTGKQVFLAVVQLPGSAAPAVVASTVAFHVATSAGTVATAGLKAAPFNPADPELILLATQGSLGTTAPPFPGAVPLTFAHTSQGSLVLYAGKARQSQTLTIPSNWWGTIALEING